MIKDIYYVIAGKNFGKDPTQFLQVGTSELWDASIYDCIKVTDFANAKKFATAYKANQFFNMLKNPDRPLGDNRPINMQLPHSNRYVTFNADEWQVTEVCNSITFRSPFANKKRKENYGKSYVNKKVPASNE